MAEEKKYRKYSAGDIEKYHKGLLSQKEMHEIERAALDDPFLADALEGYANPSINISADISELQKKLNEKIKGTTIVSLSPARSSFKWWKAAVAVIILGGAGLLMFRILTNKRDNKVALLEKKDKTLPVTIPVGNSPKEDANQKSIVMDTGATSTAKTIRAKKSLPKSPIVKNDSGDVTSADITSPSAGLFATGATDSIRGETNSVSLSTATKKSLRNDEVGNEQIRSFLSAKKANAFANQQKLNYFKGHVVDPNNNPLAFANVTSTRYNVGTYADAQGNFTLVSADSVLDVQVRSVGFENNFSRLKNNLTTNKIILQDDKTAPDRVLSYNKPDSARFRNGSMKAEEPEPADGWTNYNTYLANNLNVPSELQPAQDKGQVKLSFDVNDKGDPVNIKVEKSLCEKCDEEAVRLVKQGPKWKKKNKNAKRVNVFVPFDTDQ